MEIDLNKVPPHLREIVEKAKMEEQPDTGPKEPVKTYRELVKYLEEHPEYLDNEIYVGNYEAGWWFFINWFEDAETDGKLELHGDICKHDW